MRTLPLIGLTLVCSLAQAESYQSFTELSQQRIDVTNSNADTDITTLSSIYYVGRRQTLGPLDQLSYINTTSYINGAYSRVEDNDVLALGGKAFIDQIIAGATLVSVDDGDDYANGTLGYLISNNALVQIEGTGMGTSDDNYYVTGKYTHNLQGNDYIGATLRIDDSLDHQTLGVKYFGMLPSGRYLVGEAALKNNDGDLDLGIKGKYYFNAYTGVFAGISTEETYEIGASHYFTPNIALIGSYQSLQNGPDTNVYSVGVRFQM